MKDNSVIVKNGKELRFGYTTGSCATAAAAAAAQMLLTGSAVQSVMIRLPGGEEVAFMIEDIQMQTDRASCSVTKDAGDDPDVTDGIKLFAESSFCESGIHILGGTGIGVVTGRGLSCPVGEAAINPVPRSMILKNVSVVCEKAHYEKGICIKLSVPGGEELAKKTFNPRLGILGGISILGTTGIVEPMSEKALIDTIHLMVDKQKQIDGDNILISPGNYGRTYCKNILKLDLDKGIKFSNFVGETLDYLVYKEYKRVLLVGHAGKLIKLAGGIMNTHSSAADCRMEILAAHTALAGADQSLIRSIMECHTIEEALELIEESVRKTVLESILEKISFHIDHRVKGKLQTEIILFSQGDQMLAKSKNADRFAEMFKLLNTSSQIYTD